MDNLNIGTFCWFSNTETVEKIGRLKQIKRFGDSWRFQSSDGRWYAQCGALAKRMHQINSDNTSS